MGASTIWSRLSTAVAVLALCAGALLVGFWYLPLIRQNEVLQSERIELDRHLAEEQARAAWLTARIQALTNNPAAAERLVRERLGLGRPGETIIHFEATPSPQAQ